MAYYCGTRNPKPVEAFMSLQWRNEGISSIAGTSVYQPLESGARRTCWAQPDR